MSDRSYPVEDGPYGFRWGPAEVTRVAGLPRGIVLRVTTDAGRTVEIYVSRLGHSVRVRDVRGNGGWTRAAQGTGR